MPEAITLHMTSLEPSKKRGSSHPESKWLDPAASQVASSCKICKGDQRLSDKVLMWQKLINDVLGLLWPNKHPANNRQATHSSMPAAKDKDS